MFGLGQPSRVAWGLYLLSITACQTDPIWSHDAGPAFDAGVAPVWTFPPQRVDSGQPDLGSVGPNDAGLTERWRVHKTLPILEGYSGDLRNFALTRSPNDQPCVAFSGVGGLYFGCFVQVNHSDAGPAADVVNDPDAGRGPTASWQLERLAEQGNGVWIGAELDVAFDGQENPWVVARQMPQRITHLYRYEDSAWRHEEVPFAVGGIDPQLHFSGDALILIHGTEEAEQAPALVMSQRSADGQWTHRRLLTGYDGQPGRWHHSSLADDQLYVCSFEPSEQTVTWGFTPLNPDTNSDAGIVPDVMTSDASEHELTRSITVAGGPFCAVHSEDTFVSESLIGAIRHYRGEDRISTTPRYGPFNLTTLEGELIVLSVERQRLMIGGLSSLPFDLGPWRAHDRPELASVHNGVVTGVASEHSDRLELLIWVKLP